MGLFRRKRTEERAITEVPWDVGAPLAAPVSQQKALSLSAVWAANRHLADNISTLPMYAFRKVGEERRPMNLPPLFRRLEDTGNLVPWLYQCVTSLGLRGNAVGLIVDRDGFGFATEVVWLPMEEIHVDDTSTVRPRWFWKGREVDRSELVHIPWFKLTGRTLGLSPIESYALTVNAGLGAATYSSEWFAAGGFPPGVFRNTEKTVSQSDADEIKARLTSAIRSRRPLVHGADWNYEPIIVPPEQAQFIETMKFTATQVAAIYGIAPDELGGEAANSLTYTNEEHRQTTRMSNLRPWLVRLETAFSAITPEMQRVRFNTNAVIRADLRTRFEVYRISRDIGLNNIDELRAYEDLAPLPDGQGEDYAPLKSLPAPAPGTQQPGPSSEVPRHLAIARVEDSPELGTG